MFYGFALLLFVLSLVTGIPALRGLRHMAEIQRNGAETDGTVTSSKSAMGWLWTAGFGNQDRPLVHYQPAEGEEMVLQVITSSMLPQRRYQPGQAVVVVYDRAMPGEAYVKEEWMHAIRDRNIAALALLAAVLMTAAGLIFHIPA